MYFRFLDDIVFSHNGASGAESIRRYVWPSSPDGGTIRRPRHAHGGWSLLPSVSFFCLV